VTWHANRKLVNGLWPNCNWTEEESDLWTRTLAELDQGLLQEAIGQVATTVSATKPALKWVLDRYHELRRERNHKTIKIKDKNRERDECDEQIARMRCLIGATEHSELQKAATKVKLVLGLDIDIDKPIDGWSSFAVGCIATQITRA